jgi:triphosphoribosyl-dephospho-CoA synthase
VRPLDAWEIAWAAQLACLYEVGAPKPGNVSPGKAFADATYEDFVASALAIGPSFAAAGVAGVGETIRAAIADTRRLAGTNTNLGIVLLLAPLARAAATVGDGEDLRTAAARVLDGLTVDDARHAYAAIRMAGPAGLGAVDAHGVHEPRPVVTLREAMELARHRDAVAHEYCSAYSATFEIGYEALRAGWAAGGRLSDAIVMTFLRVLAEVPDTLISRKHGATEAEGVSRRAAQVLAAGGCETTAGRREVARLDAELRGSAHGLNPGATADLVCATLFVFLVKDRMIARVPELSARW